MLALTNVNKAMGQQAVLENVTLMLEENCIHCLLGPSGCGKSTLLRVAAGLLKADSGTVHLNPKECAMVFQEPRLLPWLTVSENLALALNHLPKNSHAEAIEQALKRIQLNHVQHYMPSELSGGMAQRVGIARAILRQPTILLMDEPFAALDAITRTELQQMLLTLMQEQKTTCLFVTHDIDEAITLGDQISIMRNGRLSNGALPHSDPNTLKTEILSQLKH